MPTIPDWLAYAYAPILPYLKKIKIAHEGPRDHNPEDILVPEGFKAEVVATGFHAPVHCTFDDEGACYVTESGHKVDAPPRILKVNTATGEVEPFFTFPEARWKKTGAVTGAVWHEGFLYVMNTDTLSRIGPDGTLEDIVTGLPGLGDHQANHPIVGPDGKLYFGVGSATNNGVVGADNFGYEWLPEYPQFHDVPGQDITLVGRNYPYQNVLGSVRETVESGAYSPFGTPSEPGQRVEGNVKCSGSVLRCNPDGSELELVAWGLRNPYGIAFAPDGRLYVTEHGMDDRGQRYVVGDFDDLYEIQPGAWYGWPDFASGIRLDDPYWGPPDKGKGREPVLAEHPDPNPPAPLVQFDPHAAANGLDFSRSEEFGFVGDAFVCLFGDVAPVTTQQMTPAGFKVVRVDMRLRRILDFAVNRIAGPASKLPHEGFERPSHCAFGPDGALYIVDFGEVEIAIERGGLRMQKETGTLWRVRRTEGPRGDRPDAPIVIPLYALQALAGVAGALGLGVAGAWLLRKWLGSDDD